MGKKLTTQEFIEKATQVHGDKYDYSKVEYINSKEKVCIICPKHGEFWQLPTVHLQGCGCQKCGVENANKKQTLSIEKFIEKAKRVHGDTYDYSKVEYANNRTKVCIICPKHGEFWQTPDCHLSGKGRRQCGYEAVSTKRGLPFEIFEKRANEIHDNKYIYVNNTYKNCSCKTKIICPIHGDFWQTPDHHLQGNGCPFCRESKLEKTINTLLKRHNLQNVRQKHFAWLKKMSLDFYLPNYKIGIECQGRQHYEAVDAFGGEKEFRTILGRDKRKKQLCEEHGVKLLYFADKQYEDNVITNEQKLIEEITKQ